MLQTASAGERRWQEQPKAHQKDALFANNVILKIQASPTLPKHGSVRIFLTQQKLHSSLNHTTRLQLQRLLEKASSRIVSQLHFEPRLQFHTRQNASKQGMNTLCSQQPAQEQSLERAETSRSPKPSLLGEMLEELRIWGTGV